MALFKCKMCGGDLILVEGQSVAECEYCGSWQTVPVADNEKKLALFARANRLRATGEFDKAASIYESIVSDFPEEAEAYWGLVLCKYGVEYVDDPATGKIIPTCHRSSFDSVMEDSDFEQAMENADTIARRVYREEAKKIEEIRKGIIVVSSNETPYDIFICYKETDENGARTLDSVLAQDLYDALTEKGYRTFFARITLEDKLGQEYEPYIFAALNSAKIMLAVGTDYEYFNAVWVKNEWSRFLKLMERDKAKHLIPCFKGIDAYDMPREFAKLQAQDLGKVGALQDLLRGIEKLMPQKNNTTVIQGRIYVGGNDTITPLLKRVSMFLEDKDWKSADTYCEKVLDMDPEIGEAYFGKLLAEYHVSSAEELSALSREFTSSANYQKALRFADKALTQKLETVIRIIDEREEAQRREKARREEEARQKKARQEQLAREEAVRKAEIARKKAEHIGKRTKKIAMIAVPVVCTVIVLIVVWTTALSPLSKYNKAVALMDAGQYTEAVTAFEALDGYRDSAAKISECNTSIQESKYSNAMALMDTGNYAEAITAFEALDGYQDSAEKLHACILEHSYNDAIALMYANQYQEAIAAFEVLDGYKDCTDQILKCRYSIAAALQQAGKTKEAMLAFSALDNYSDAKEQVAQLRGKLAGWKTIDAGNFLTIGLQADGVLVAGHRYSNFIGWNDIVAIAVGRDYAVGLKADGTVVADGANTFGQCDVSGWNEVVAIAASKCRHHTVGLKADGTVVAVGLNEDGQCDVSGWSDIVAISAGINYTVGLKADGTVVAVGNNKYGQCNVSSWTDIVAISAGIDATIGLKANGTVVAVGDNKYGQCDVTNWSNIVAISAGGYHTVGLRADGTVVAVGDNEYGQCDISSWTNIAAITTGGAYTVGLKADGTVVAVGYNQYGQCNVGDWTNIALPGELTGKVS